MNTNHQKRQSSQFKLRDFPVLRIDYRARPKRTEHTFRMTSIFRYLILICIISISALKLNAQELSARSKNTRDKVARFIGEEKLDSAQIMAMLFAGSKDLTPQEVFYSDFLFAHTVTASYHPLNAIPLLFHTREHLTSLPDSTVYLSLLYGEIAECYFTSQKFDSAVYYAVLSIEKNNANPLRKNGHAINYLIVGYEEYLDSHYDAAIEDYERAAAVFENSGATCNLPLCYTKIASAQSALGNAAAADRALQRSMQLSDSCGLEEYVLLTKRTRFDILYKNKNYELALKELMEINALISEIETRKLDQQMADLATQYETEHVKEDNIALQDVNAERAEVLSRKKQQLIALIAVLIVLALMLALLIRNSIKRKKVESKLATLNADLERKVTERTKHLTEANRDIRVNTDTLIFQNKQLVDFCNIISHNLRSPMRNVTTLLQFVDNTNDEDEKREIISKLKPVIQSMNTTFDELIESLQVKQNLEIKLDEMNLSDALSRTTQEMAIEITSASAKVTGNFTNAPVVKYPSKYLLSILHNLISNAVKYKSPDRLPEIHLETHWENNSIVLTVSDNGLGIDLVKNGEKLFKIGKIFHQHPDAKGFGLFITKTQVEAMRGSISAESLPGKGSRFIITFANQK